MLTSILIASANRYICTIPTLYSQLVIIPLAHELQFLHWKKSASPNWYWFFRQPHTVSCFWVHGVFSICCNSEERNEKWLYHPYLQLRPLLWQQVLLALNLPTGEKKKKKQATKAANSISDCSNFANLIPAVSGSLPLHCPLYPLSHFFSRLAHSSCHPLQTLTYYYHPFSSGSKDNSPVRHRVHWKHFSMMLSTAVNVPLGQGRQTGAWPDHSQSFNL